MKIPITLLVQIFMSLKGWVYVEGSLNLRRLLILLVGLVLLAVAYIFLPAEQVIILDQLLRELMNHSTLYSG